MITSMDQDEIIALGSSLRPIDQRLLKKNQSIERIWYQGEEPYFDVFFELENNELIWFQFTLRGKVLLWDQHNPTLQTGKTNELVQNDVSYYAASKIIRTDIKADLDFVELVRAILKTRAGETIFDRTLAIFDRASQVSG